MKPNQTDISAADQRLTRVLRLGVAVLVIGALAFAGIYYKDQHVSAGPTMVERQIAGAEAAVEKTPNDIQVRLQLAAAYLQAKRPDDALAQYDEILKADKGNRTVMLGRGRILAEKGDLTAAALSYHQITDVAVKGEFAGADPVAQEAYYFLGSILVKQGKTKEAITQLEKALRIDKTDSDALYLMGVAQLKEDAPQLAVTSLKRALLFVPTGWCEPYSQLAVAYGKLAQAPQKTYAAGMASFCLEKPAEAKTQLKTLITGPVRIEALLGLGQIAESESSKSEAASWYKKVLVLDANNATATSALSRLGVGSTPGHKSSSTTQGPS